VHLRALAGAAQQELQRARERKVVQHVEQIGPARGHQLGREVLQPHLARGDAEAAGGEDEGRDRVNARAEAPRNVDRRGEQHEPGRVVEAPLQEAQGTGVLALEVLQVIAAREQPGAGGRDERRYLPKR